MEHGDLHIGFGIMGGWNQAQAHAQFVSNVIDGGMNIQGALEAPRFTKLDFGGCNVMMERRLSPEVRDKLRALGYVSAAAPVGKRYTEDDDPKRLIDLDASTAPFLASRRPGRASGRAARPRPGCASS